STFKATADASPPKHAVAFVNGDQYYGAKASINVWTVCHSYWLSLVSDLLGKHSDLMEGFSSFWDRCENIGYRGVLNGNERCHISSSFTSMNILNIVSSPTLIVERAGSNAWTHKSGRIREEFAKSVTSAIGLFASTELPVERDILPSILPMLYDPNPGVREADILCIEVS
ncbi:CLIP-associated protein, partial [Tanacetum coccineum]